MFPSSTIPIVRASGFGPLPDLLEERAGERALLDIFEKERVPAALRSLPDTPMPLSSMMGLFSRGARLLGDRLFGLDIGERMTHRGYGLWTEFGSLGHDLGEALNRSVATGAAHFSGARLEVVAEGDERIFRFVVPRQEVSAMQHADHLLPTMVTFMRQYLGTRWQPARFEVSYARDADAHRLEERLQVPVRFGRPGTGVVLKASDLSRRRDPDFTEPRRFVTLRDVVADMVLRDAPEPARSISSIVTLRLLDGRTDIDGAARLAGFSVQGLQRRLRQQGYTYREVLDAARRARAVSLLHETRLPLVQIGLSLGYEDQANFTRAFSRWFSHPPSDVRRQGA